MFCISTPQHRQVLGVKRVANTGSVSKRVYSPIACMASFSGRCHDQRARPCDNVRNRPVVCRRTCPRPRRPLHRRVRPLPRPHAHTASHLFTYTHALTHTHQAWLAGTLYARVPLFVCAPTTACLYTYTRWLWLWLWMWLLAVVGTLAYGALSSFSAMLTQADPS